MKKLPSTIKAFLIFLWILLGLSAESPTASAAPFVDSYTLVSSVRSGRTTFDYTYRPLIRVDGNSYRNAVFTVTSKNAATQILKAVINAGDLDAGNVVLAPDTFTIRQDRLVPFDRTVLDFAFSGTIVSKDVGPSDLSVGTLMFLEQGGRLGHELMLPIQGTDPPAAQPITMSVDIYGSVLSASYKLLDQHSMVIASDSLSQFPDAHTTSPRYATIVPVPSQPFRVEISAVGTASTFVWLSRFYMPTVTTLRIDPAKGILSKGETVSVILRLASTDASSSSGYTVRLLLPPGFSGGAGPWTVTLAPGETRDITTSITAPATGAQFVRHTIYAEALAAQPDAVPVSSVFALEVE